MTQKLLLNIQLIWMIFEKILRIKNPNKKQKILIVFHDMFAHMLSNQN